MNETKKSLENCSRGVKKSFLVKILLFLQHKFNEKKIDIMEENIERKKSIKSLILSQREREREKLFIFLNKVSPSDFIMPKSA